MAGELSAADVAARLDELRRIYVAETVEEGCAGLERERPLPTEPFASAVARRLEELRALSELTTYLHRRRCEQGQEDGGFSTPT